MKVFIIIAIILLSIYLIKVIIRYTAYLKQSKKNRGSRNKAIDIYKKYMTEAEIKIINNRFK